MNINKLVVEVLYSLGYRGNPSGYCYGLSMRWLEAVILGEEAAFIARMDFIIARGSELANLLRLVKEKKGVNLTDDDKTILEVEAFSDSLQLYQSPTAYFSLYNKMLVQPRLEEISILASCDHIMEMGGIAKIYSETGGYTAERLTNYLDGLKAVFDSILPETSGRFLLSSDKHATVLTYDPGIGWNYMDSNSFPPVAFSTTETHALAQIIMGSTLYQTLNITAITTANNEQMPQLKDLLESFKQEHEITVEDIEYQNTNGLLAVVAAMEGHIDVILALEESGADLEKATDDGWTAVMIAAKYGNADIVAELAKYNVNLDKALPEGWTALMFAAVYGHTDVIEAFAKYGVDLNKATPSGWTAMILAAQEGQVNAITTLVEHGADCNQARSDGCTPAFMAAQKGHPAVIKELMRLGADFSLPFVSTDARLRAFASKFNEDVIKRMNAFISTNQAQPDELISMTVSDIAGIMGHQDIVEMLQNRPAVQQPMVSNRSATRSPTFFQAHPEPDEPTPSPVNGAALNK